MGLTTEDGRTDEGCWLGNGKRPTMDRPDAVTLYAVGSHRTAGLGLRNFASEISRQPAARVQSAGHGRLEYRSPSRRADHTVDWIRAAVSVASQCHCYGCYSDPTTSAKNTRTSSPAYYRPTGELAFCVLGKLSSKPGNKIVANWCRNCQFLFADFRQL